MFSGRGWSYSDSRRRRHRGAIRASRRRSRRPWLATLALAAALLAASLAVMLPLGATAPGPSDAATPEVLAARPLPTGSPTVTARLATLPPTAVRAPTATLVPTPTAIPRPVALLPEHRIVSFYGNPLAKQMGILGEVPPDQMLNKLKQQIAAYSANDSARPFVPALELVTPAAQGWPGEDGLYRARMKPEIVDQVA